MEFVWLGARDGAEEGVWLREDDGRPLATSGGQGLRKGEWKVPWETRPREPNGGNKENCAAMKRG